MLHYEERLYNKVWVTYTNPSHVEPPTIPLVKETSTGKSDRYYVKLKLRIDPTSSCRNMSCHALMGRPAARLETMELVKQTYVLV